MRQRTEALQSLCETMGNAAASALAETSRRNPIARRIDALSLAISLADRKKFRESGTQLRPTPKNGASIDTQKKRCSQNQFLERIQGLVGEEVVKPPRETKALQQSAGESGPLKAKGNFEASPHLPGGASARTA